MVYGVDVEDARQIPLKKYIEGCINGKENYDVNQYAEIDKQFDTILEEVIQYMDSVLIGKIAHCLYKLARKSDVTLRVQQRTAQLKLKKSTEKQVLPAEYQELPLHLDMES